jgi:hypothetical protein
VDSAARENVWILRANHDRVINCQAVTIVSESACSVAPKLSVSTGAVICLCRFAGRLPPAAAAAAALAAFVPSACAFARGQPRPPRAWPAQSERQRCAHGACAQMEKLSSQSLTARSLFCMRCTYTTAAMAATPDKTSATPPVFMVKCPGFTENHRAMASTDKDLSFPRRYVLSSIAATVAETCCASTQPVSHTTVLTSDAGTFPIDITKTRLQVQSAQIGSQAYRGMMATAAGIVKEEGVRALWRGLSPAVLRHLVYR